MRAFAGVAAELGVGHRDRDGLRLGLLHLGHLEEAAREGRLRRRAVRDHREIFVVVEGLVDAGAEQADEQLLPLDHDRHRRRDLAGGIAADDQIDFVDVEQLGVDAGHLRRIALIVVVDQLDRPAEQPAFGVDVVFPDLHRQQRRLAVGRQRTGQRHAEADLDRLFSRCLGFGRRRGEQQRGGGRRQRQTAYTKPLQSRRHFLPSRLNPEYRVSDLSLIDGIPRGRC